MKIWLINPYDELPGEGPEQRYARLARELAKQAKIGDSSLEMGGGVVWVSSTFRHRQKSEVRGQKSEDLSSGFRLILVDAPGYQKNVSVRRLWSQWKWGRNVYREMVRRVESGELEKPDVVLASSPPLEGARAGIRLARRFGAKAAVDFMDDWPATWAAALRAGRWEMGDGRLGKLLLWPWSRLARKVYSSADAVSAQSHTFAERARELGYEGEVYVCYLGGTKSYANANIEHSTSNIEHRSVATQSPLNPSTTQPFSILYLGGMGRIYDIETVLQAASMAKEAGKKWQWTLAGEDPDGRWERRAEELGLQGVISFPGYVVGGALEEVKESADVGLMPMDPDSKVAVPYKLGEYCMAGLAVVNSLPGEADTLLRGVRSSVVPAVKPEGENGVSVLPLVNHSPAGISYEFGNPDWLFKALHELAMDSERLAEMKVASRRLGETVFNREKTYPEFAEWVKGQA